MPRPQVGSSAYGVPVAQLNTKYAKDTVRWRWGACFLRPDAGCPTPRAPALPQAPRSAGPAPGAPERATMLLARTSTHRGSLPALQVALTDKILAYASFEDPTDPERFKVGE